MQKLDETTTSHGSRHKLTRSSLRKGPHAQVGPAARVQRQGPAARVLGASELVGAAPKPTGTQEPAVIAPKQPAEAPTVNPDSQMTTLGLGTVLWAKLQGELANPAGTHACVHRPPFGSPPQVTLSGRGWWSSRILVNTCAHRPIPLQPPALPASVTSPVARWQAATVSQPGMVFVKFFGTHDFAFCETLLRWEGPDAKGRKCKMPGKAAEDLRVGRGRGGGDRTSDAGRA